MSYINADLIFAGSGLTVLRIMIEDGLNEKVADGKPDYE